MTSPMSSGVNRTPSMSVHTADPPKTMPQWLIVGEALSRACTF
jgi:hypothetical protein